MGGLRDVITCAEFQIEIFMGYDFTGGRIFDFPIDFSMGLTTLNVNVTWCKGCVVCSGGANRLPAERCASFCSRETVIELESDANSTDISCDTLTQRKALEIQQ